MRERGYVEIYTDATVREIAHRAGRQAPELDAALDELETLDCLPFEERDNNWALQRLGVFTRIDQLLLAGTAT